MKHLAHDHWNAPKARAQGDLLDDTAMFADEIAYVSVVGSRWTDAVGSRYTEAICRADGGGHTPYGGALEYGQVHSMDGLFGSLNLTEPE